MWITIKITRFHAFLGVFLEWNTFFSVYFILWSPWPSDIVLISSVGWAKLQLTVLRVSKVLLRIWKCWAFHVQLLFVSVLSMELKGQPDQYSQSDLSMPTVYFLLAGQGLWPHWLWPRRKCRHHFQTHGQVHFLHIKSHRLIENGTWAVTPWGVHVKPYGCQCVLGPRSH